MCISRINIYGSEVTGGYGKMKDDPLDSNMMIFLYYFELQWENQGMRK